MSQDQSSGVLPAADTKKSTAALKKTSMSLIGVVALIFSFVAAGAFGIEEAISASGPGLTLIMLVVFPFIWAFPLSEMVGELGSLYPTEGGIYSWARESLGEFWGWQAGFWSGISTWLCQAQYCALVAGYAAKYIPMSETTEYLVKLAVVLVFTIINIIGLESLEKLETVFTVIVIIAFVAVTVVGLINWNYNPVTPIYNEDEGVLHSIGGGISIIIWMYCGYECMSNMAGELNNPQVIPKAMRISQPVIALTYVLPTLAALAAIGSWSAWNTDSGAGHVGYADVLIQNLGSWAGILFVLVAVLSNCSIFCSYIAHGSRAFFVMADDHMFPKFMAKVDKRGVPVVAIVLLAIFTAITCKFDFATLVMATTPIQLFLYLALAACIIKVRKEYPVEDRRKMGLTVMPGGKIGLVVCTGLVMTICIIALYINGTEYFVVGFLILAISLALYLICKWVYKGRVKDDPDAYPLNAKTKLGIGDIRDTGVFITLAGIGGLAGSFILNWYDGSYGTEYYLEEYGSGLFSNFDAMIGLCRWLGLILLVVGIILWFIGHKTEGSELQRLEPLRKHKLDEMIKELHGKYPGEK